MKRLALAVLVLVVAAGCGAGERSRRTLEVAEAREAAPDDVVRVRGLLYTDDRARTFRLCSALAESYPPQCGEPSLLVESSVYEFDDLTHAGDVGWSEQPVDVTGRVFGGVLTVTDVEE
jgi:hypothetical protein